VFYAAQVGNTAIAGVTSKQSGTTLVELMVTLSIAFILITQAIPSFTQILNSNNLGNAGNLFLASLQLARSEAIKRNGRVVLCKSIDSTSCIETGHWNQGWIIFNDTDNNAQVSGIETIIHFQHAFTPNTLMQGNTHINKYISYAPTGSAKLLTGAFQVGSIILCNKSSDSSEARKIYLSSTGRARMQKLTIASCPIT
jgi:type IV fimbrial biogenesis protein FimT